MAKRKQNTNGDESPKERIFHTTDRGHTIEIKAVPPFLLDRMNRAVPVPKVPTYTATIAGGEDEIHPHDETTISTDEEKQAWANYQLALENAAQLENENMMKVLIMEGIEVDMSGEQFETWKEKQEYYGLEIPKNKFDLKIYYVETEILSSLADLGEIMYKVMSQSGVAKEVAEQALDSFQAGIQRIADSETPVEIGELEA